MDDKSPIARDDMLEAYADRLWESVETHQLSDIALAALSDMVVDCSASGRILRANPAFCAFVGLSNEELEGRDGHEFAFMQNRDQSHCTVELNTLNGETVWLDRIQLSLRDPKSGNRFVRIVGRDVTQYKMSEIQLIDARQRAEAADEAKSRFLAMVSHEIRTPLNGIIGMGKLLADTKLSPEQQSYIEAVTTSGQALLVLVNDLLQFGKQELSDDQPKPEPCDLRPLVAGVIELLAERAHSKEIDLGYCFSADLPEIVSVDTGRLRQMLFNIIGNAVKFTATGGVRVDVSFSEPNSVSFKVTDTGPGIEDNYLKKIFEPFEQVEDTFTRTHEGAGLGLAISKKIANAMGGDITVESTPDIGSKFLIRLNAEALRKAPEHHTSLKNQMIIMICKSGFETDILEKTILNAGGQVEHTSAEKLLFIIGTVKTRLVSLIQPSERGIIGAEYNAAGQAFLTRPVRPSTVLRVLNQTVHTEVTSAGDTEAKHSKAPHKTSTKLNILLAEDNPINALLAQNLLDRKGHQYTWVENGADAVVSI
ncbi:Hybrid signal transduction histidine kinase J [Nymphon striatum]|nr:Hybrid signal transduction histidine kinase J [Nymphon striatum]